MENQSPRISSTVRTATSALAEVVRCEVRLAKAEIRDSSGKMGKRATQTAVFGVIGLLGVPPFIAFLVIGLGSLLGGIYWLSALIVSLVLFAVGGTFAYQGFARMRSEGLSLPETRETLGESAEVLQQGAHRIADVRQTIRERRSS